MDKNIIHLNQRSSYHKIKVGLNLGPIAEQNNIIHYSAVYIGSGLDLEFPLLLRARKIFMIDPIFSHQENINSLMQKILLYDNTTAQIKPITSFHSHASFNFDFGYGPEKVTVDIFSKSYEDYRHILPIGYIIEFNSRLDHTLHKTELIDRLVNNGIIINNYESPLRHKSFSLPDLLHFGQNLDQLEDLKAKYLGLKTIRIENVPFTIYQKTDSPNPILQPKIS